MNPATFEEREYETPLYNQLAYGTRNVWSPGQVFEGHIGLDHGVLHRDELIFLMHGYPHAPRGAALARYSWPRAWFRRRDRSRLPNFRLNLFIQAKRSEWSARPTKVLRARGFTGTYWRFKIEEHQQRALARVARTLQKRALVVYAAPAFHRHEDLLGHTLKGTLVKHSTFPSIAALAGHSAWNYDRPGAVGIANADPTPIT
jgi:hypothetical protein